MKITYRIEFSENRVVGMVDREKHMDYDGLAALLMDGSFDAPEEGEGYNKTSIEMFVDGEQIGTFHMEMQRYAAGTDFREHLQQHINFYQTERGENYARNIANREPSEMIADYARFLGLTFVG